MKYTKFVIGLFVQAFLMFPVYGQNLDEIAPPSPDVAALMQYVESPVNKYTGVPNINIPLYTIEHRGVQVPISLNYHAGGIKVAQEASWVGLGWSLNAGGCISREIRGYDDFKLGGWRHDERELPDPYNPVVHMEYLQVIDNGVYTVSRNDRDGESDIYYYNFLGLSGKFLMRNGGEIFLIEKSGDFTVTTVPEAANGAWKIVTNKGVELIFDEVEITKTTNNTTEAYGSGSGTMHESTYVTAWYLSEIVLPNDEKIDFIYTNMSNASKTVVSTSHTSNIPMQVMFYSQARMFTIFDIFSKPPADANFKSPMVPNIFTQTEAAMQTQKVLSRIDWPMGNVTFTTTDRSDLRIGTGSHNPQKLSAITVQAYNQIVPVHRVNFLYDYFNAGQSYKLQRLKLDAVTIDDANYTFDYYESVTNRLPPKDSQSKDHWGYFNNEDNLQGNGNPYFIPAYHWSKDFADLYSYRLNVASDGMDGTFISGGSIKVDRDFEGANREPSEFHSKLGTLKSIIYPTGGVETFDYELNDHFLEVANVEIQEIPIEVIVCEDHGERDDNTDGEDFCMQYHQGEVAAEEAQNCPSSKSFYVEKACNAVLSAYVTRMTAEHNGDEDHYCDPHNFNILKFCKLQKINYEDQMESNIPPIVDFSGNFAPANYEPCNGGPENPTVGVYNYELALSPGWYRLTVSDRYLDRAYAKAELILKPVVELNDVTAKKKVGGLRVKSIESEAGTRVFHYDEYSEEHGGYISSGVRMLKPIYATLVREVSWCNGATTNMTYLRRRSNSFLNLFGSKSGNFVGYRVVTEEITDSDGNVSTIISEYDSYPEYTPFYDLPSISNLNSGDLLKETFLMNDKLLYEEVYTYTNGIRSDGVRAWGCCNTLMVHYQTPSCFHYLSGKTKYSYSSNGEDKLLVEKTTYHYNREMVLAYTTETTNNDFVKTNYHYPKDVLINNPESPEYDVLKAQCKAEYQSTVINGLSSFYMGLVACLSYYSEHQLPCYDINVDRLRIVYNNHKQSLMAQSFDGFRSELRNLLNGFPYGTIQNICPGDGDHAAKEQMVIDYFKFPEETYVAECITNSSETLEEHNTEDYITLNKMIDEGMLGVPLEIVASHPGGYYSGTSYEYRVSEHGLIVPHKTYKFNRNSSQEAYHRLKINFLGNFERDGFFGKPTSIDHTDAFGNILQYHNYDDYPVTIQWGYNNNLPVAVTKNAELGNCVFENFEEGEGDIYGLTRSDVQVKNGLYSGQSNVHQYKQASKSILASDVGDNRKFRYSAYIYCTGNTAIGLGYNNLNNIAGVQICSRHNEWVWVEGYADLPPDASSWCLAVNVSGGTVYVDDVRVYPADAQMTTYGHIPLKGVSTITDERGHETRYEYDQYGRLLGVWDSDGNLINAYEYNYAP